MPSTTTPNMSLIVPTIGSEPSPAWATDLNSNFTYLDQHNHASGSGVQITPAGLNISSDLSFIQNNATNLRSARFFPQGSPLALGTDLNCLYVSGVDLYYNDGSGNQIRLTQNGSGGGSGSTIPGLVAPASLTYVPATPAFVFQSNVNTPANLDAGGVTFRKISASSPGISIAPQSSLSVGYSMTLPNALPGSPGAFMTISNTGVMDVSTSLSLGITTGMIAANAVTNGKIQTNPQFVANGGSSVSISTPGSSGNIVISDNFAGGQQYKLLQSGVSSAGVRTSGSTYTSITNPVAGNYVFTFITAFADVPCVTGASTSGAVLIFVVNSVSTTTCSISLYTTGSVNTNSAFNIQIVGRCT